MRSNLARKALFDVIDLNRLVKDAYQLKPLPATVTRLAALVANPHSSMQEIVQVISFDQSLTGRVIRAANAAFSAPRVPIATVERASVRIGTGSILALATAASVSKQVNMACPGYGLTEGDLWRHSVAAGLAAETMRAFCDAPIPPASFTAALLHDVGKLVLGRHLTPDLIETLNFTRQEWGVNELVAEKRVLNVHHGEVGALMAKHWKLPKSIVKAILCHHEPEKGGDRMCDVVYVADIVAHHVVPRPNHEPPTLDIETAQRIALRIDQFERLCQRVTDRLDDVMQLYSN
jgi:putative nucleotidyltransferase with HDIG domain